jgi:dolichol-phosphate mannosyltransferase
MTRVVVLIPTYNEAENIRSAVSSVRSSLSDASVIVLDDASPDGTGRIADAIAADDSLVSVIHRTKKNGLGDAYLDGFQTALTQGFDIVIEFDADGSHPATVLPELVRAVRADGVGLSIGSRWVDGGSVIDWPRYRLFLSRGGNTYARLMLGLSVRDSTAGFRAYRAACLRTIDLGSVKTKGYGFQVDMTRRVKACGFGIVEVPIAFRERTRGQSKMSGAIIFEAMWMVTIWGLQRPLAYFQRALSRG